MPLKIQAWTEILTTAEVSNNVGFCRKILQKMLSDVKKYYQTLPVQKMSYIACLCLLKVWQYSAASLLKIQFL